MMDLKQHVRVLRAHWLLIAVSVLGCTGAAGLLAWTHAPVYAARTQLFVSASSGSTDPSQTYQGGLFARDRVLSYAQIVSSPMVATAVMSQLNIAETVAQFRAEVTAVVPANTVLINVTVKDRSPQRAKTIADAVGEEFPRFVGILETPQGGGNSPVEVSVMSQAQLPTSPVSSRKSLDLALGALLGLVAGTGGAVLREVVDNRIRHEDDAVASTRTAPSSSFWIPLPPTLG
jgi:polysaccharide biosynthesis transport protein